ncbi:MAG TPA: DUF1573 domain-containing protein [Phycisphaerae bacterium]|nr:DUF1573 domain-containing protein [Phycisphaerae bacterium]
MSRSRMAGWPSAGIVALSALVAVVLAVQVGSQQTNAPSTQPSGASDTVAAGKTGPKLEVDEASLDLGEMWGDQQKEHAIILRNVGDDTLMVTKVKGSCGCTVIKTYDRQIAPGKEGKLPFTLNTKGMQGTVRKSVTIWTNDPSNEQTRVSIHGTVKQLIQKEPKGGFTFGRIQPAQSQNKQVELTSNADEPLELEIVEVTPKGFNVTLETVEEGKRFLLTAQIQPPLERGMHKGHVLLKTNLPKMPQLKVPLSAYIPERITVVPRKIMVFSSTEGKSRPRYAFMRYEPVTVLECQASDERIKVELEHRPEHNDYRITLTLPEDYQPPKGGDKLVIKTDEQAFAELVIPIVQVSRSEVAPKANEREITQSNAPISANTQERVSVVPHEILVVAPAEGESHPPYHVFLHYEPVKILECQASDERIKVELDHRQERNNYRITLTLPEDYQPPKGGDKLVIKTDDEEFGEFVIPIVQVSRSEPAPVSRRKAQPGTGTGAKPAD